MELAVADLSSPASIRRFAKEFEQTHGGLDVVINNAAVFTRTRTVTSDGLEAMFATNHLGPFLLTNLLLGLLKSSAPSRVINVTAPSTSKLDFGRASEGSRPLLRSGDRRWATCCSPTSWLGGWRARG